MSLIWVLGAEAALGPDGLGVLGYSSSITQVVPVLLIGLGVDYAIHLTARYREEIAAGAGVRVASNRAAGAVGVALVLGATTTAVGFLTNVFNPVPTLRDFGILAALGIAGAFLLMLTFVPAMRILLDRRAERRDAVPVAAMRKRVRGIAGRVAAGLAWPAQRFAAFVVAVAVVSALVGGYALTLLDTRFSLVDFVPDGTPALAARETLLERFSGGLGERTSVLLEGPVGEPDVYNELVAALKSLSAVDDVVDLGDGPLVESPVSVVAALAAEDAEFAEFAAGRGMTADLTFAPDGSPGVVFDAAADIAPDAVASVLEPDGAGSFGAAVVRITTRAGEEGAADLAAALDRVFSDVATAGVDVTVTSEGIIVDAVKRALSESQTVSLVITLGAAMALLVVAFWWEARRPFLGVITILPVVLVVLWTYGMMVATGIPFSPTTAMVAALAIGIGVDYTIHMVRRYLEDRARFTTLAEAVGSTARNTGAALTGSALTTLAGFGILVTSSLGPFRELGAVVVFAIGFSLFAAVVALPAMLVLWDRWHAMRDREAVAHLRDGGTASGRGGGEPS
jgi:predicted RND superfamily exporter protein